MGTGLAATAGCLSLGPSPGDTIEPVTIPTFDAPGSEAGSMDVPQPGSVTVIDMFATWCAPCKPTVERLATAREQLGVAATFVSVTGEVFNDSFGEDDVVEWWRQHGGPWTVGHDPDSTLTVRLNASKLPTTVVVDADRTLVWSHTGIPKAESVAEKVRSAVE